MQVINKKPRKTRLYIALSAVLLLVVGSVTFLVLRNQDEQPSGASAPSASSGTKGEADSGNDTANTTSPTENPATNDKDGGSAQTNPSAELLTPSGAFVSAHKNVPLDAPLSSVCNTTPAANCQIIFTKADGTQKSLPMRTVDKGGSAYWDNMTAKSIGLSAGSWKVKATATLGNQTKSADDAMDLEIAS